MHLFLAATLLLVPACSANAQTAAQNTGILSGILEDSAARPLAGVTLTLSGDGPPARTATSSAGEYTFRALPPGRYHITAEQPGTSLSPAGAVILTADHPEVRLTLTLSGATANQPQSTANAGLNLKGAGIRGYIDPGGYSAPASAAAATDLVRGIADLKRAGGGSTGSANCHNLTGSLQTADSLVQTGHFQAARDLLVLQTQPTAQTHRLLARADEGLGDFLDAAHEYQAAIDLQPAEEDYFSAGYEQVLAGAPQAGNQLFQAGFARFPHSTTLLMGIGTVQFLAKSSAEATRTFLRAAELNPADPRPYPFLSASFQVSNFDPAAVNASFRRFYSLAPDNAQAAYFYALSLTHQGSSVPGPQQVETLLQRSVQLDPSFTKAHIQLGSLYFHQEHYTAAVTEYQAALKLDPTLWDVHYRLSAAYKRTGDTQRAAEEMQLFQAHRTADAAAGPAEAIPMEEFLSVFKRTGDLSGTPSGTAACPERAAQ